MTVITGPGELVALIPSMLGFEPFQSVVVVLVKERGAMAAMIRLDARDLLTDDAPEIAFGVARHAVREGARRAVVLGFLDDASACGAAIDAVTGALADTVGEVESWLVVDGRYFCPDCADPSCCPPGGRIVPDAGHPGERTWRAGSPGWTRAAPEARRLSARAADRAEGRAARDLVRWRRSSLDEWLVALDDGVGGPAPLGRLAAGLGDVRVRDAVLLALIPGAEDAVDDALDGRDSAAIAASLGSGMRPSRPPDPDRTYAAGEMLRNVLAHAPSRLSAPPAATLGVLAWWTGDAASARSWCEIALDADPGYRLALLTLALIGTASGEA